MKDTLDYYNENADAFVADTQGADMHDRHELFLQYVAEGGHILDLGCGSGRDSKAFIERGYQVTAVDGSEELCRIAAEHIGQPVYHMLFQDIAWQDMFDGVWASASLLHCTIEELPAILQKVADSLKQGGTLFVSFKYGAFTGWVNGRFYTNLSEASFAQVLAQVPSLQLVHMAVNGDVRPGRAHEMWLNAIVKKV